MTHNEYNGWWNYETWNVALWMDNDSYSYWQERVEEVCRESSDRDDAVSTLAHEIQNQHEEDMPEVSGTYSDLLSASLREVNWYEIAEHLVDDYVSENPDVFPAEETEDETEEQN